MSETKPGLTAADVRTALRKHFSGDGSVILEEVGNGTGHRAARWIDMMVMETWPSRGYAVHGIEIKISRGDWLRELKQPAKAEALHQHCDLWWIATAGKVILSTDELPAGWGWIDVRPERTVVVSRAKRIERAPHIPREVVAAMLRAHTRDTDKRISAAVLKEAQTAREHERERIRRESADAADKGAELLRKMTAALGEGRMSWLDTDQAVAAWRLVHALNLHSTYSPLKEISHALAVVAERAKDLHADLAAQMKATGLEPPPPPKPRRLL